MRNTLIIFIAILFMANPILAQKKTDAHLIGHVVNGDEHIPFASVYLKGTTIGTSTDETGHYRMINLPVGKHTVVASAIGYRQVEKQVTIIEDKTIELNFSLDEDAIGLDEVVVTGDRNEIRKRESTLVVNTVTPKTFNMTQSSVLGEGLNYIPGLRLENNCQNCGFTQLRINGLEGPYSQILVNSRPIFSGLAGVYGLELIPSNMVDRVEVIRGGGSTLYGSNAVAGTVNLILKDPIYNSYELSVNSMYTGVGMSGAGLVQPDNNATFSATSVSSDLRTGLAVFGFVRDRKPFDANNDGFSEQAAIGNTSVGARAFHRFGHRNKLSLDFFNIRENRRGGNKFELPEHEADVTEAVGHVLTTGGLTYDQFFREDDVLSIFVSGQNVDRDSYYGANQSLSSYGATHDISYVLGGQYNAKVKDLGLAFGIENQGGVLKDNKLGYPDLENAYEENGEIVVPHVGNVLLAHEQQVVTGAFTQAEYAYYDFKVTAGLRYDHYSITNKVSQDNDISGNVLSPRVTLYYDIGTKAQLRASYAKGFRAPQVFDEDLHVETSTARRVIHQNAPGLKQETSHSIMGSVAYNLNTSSLNSTLLVEGFYTLLENPFMNEFGEPDEEGNVIYTRVNSEGGASVQGLNLELTMAVSRTLSLNSGFTLQTSKYQEEQDFNERRFFRTPDTYGFFALEVNPTRKLTLNATGTYTGKMLVPYFGPTLSNPDEGELRVSNPFFELGLKASYDFKINGATMQLFAGVKNLFNSYQKDFDIGANRDPGYMYGPNQPRAIYVGLRIGNKLK